MVKTKGILLYSGGLDSIIAAKLLLDQKIDLIGFHCILPYYPPDLDPENLQISIIAKEIGLKLHHYRCGMDYIEMLKNPAHGYGKNINPCIDCKMYFLKKAEKFMEEENADFIATGEVVGQRPMSQLKHTLNHIENSTNLKGRLLRPLSAKILNPTIVEEEGRVDRELLLDINGRGRKRQMELAAEYGITDYSSPSGGCLFTEMHIAARIRDLFKHHSRYNEIDMYLITVGRHYRLNDTTKIIVSRNESEGNELEKYRNYSDYIFIPRFSGPDVLVKGPLKPDDVNLISSITARYGKPKIDDNQIVMIDKDGNETVISAPDPITDKRLNSMRI